MRGHSEVILAFFSSALAQQNEVRVAEKHLKLFNDLSDGVFIEVKLPLNEQDLLVEQLAQHKHGLAGLLLLLFHQLDLFFAERLVRSQDFFVLTGVESQSRVKRLVELVARTLLTSLCEFKVP